MLSFKTNHQICLIWHSFWNRGYVFGESHNIILAAFSYKRNAVYSVILLKDGENLPYHINESCNNKIENALPYKYHMGDN